MKGGKLKLESGEKRFFEKQGFVIVCTLDEKGAIHTSAKGIVGIEDDRIYLLDLYEGRTYNNLKRNKTVSITAVDEHEFSGYNIKGTASIVKKDDYDKHIEKKWKEKIVKRVTNRIIKNIKNSKRSGKFQPEAKLPSPKYLIVVEVNEIVNLTPSSIKE